jgi:hypothetical protein
MITNTMMFYEEQVIDGVLMCRLTPNGKWGIATSDYAAAANALLALNDDQRIAAMSFFCSHCGTKQPTYGSLCQCWNDE